MKVKKSVTKAELLSQLKDVQKKYDALEKEHKRNIDIIKDLKVNNAMFKKAKETLTKESQTETDRGFNCFECKFVGSSNKELKWHMSENHGWPNFVDTDENIDDNNTE